MYKIIMLIATLITATIAIYKLFEKSKDIAMLILAILTITIIILIIYIIKHFTE